ncbi:hypothetical protein F1880_002028 [Penicillium rolfsii]|nr:hypothetical protein F1880_002028 [Penicillium rolfsii]
MEYGVVVSQIGLEIRTGDTLWAWDGCRGGDWWENASLVAPRQVDPPEIRRQWGQLERTGRESGRGEGSEGVVQPGPGMTSGNRFGGKELAPGRKWKV